MTGAGQDQAVVVGVLDRPVSILAGPPPNISLTALERHEIARVTARLSVRFLGLEPGVVQATVDRLHRRFEACRVRTYVPLLVERLARTELEAASPGESPPTARAWDEAGRKPRCAILDWSGIGCGTLWTILRGR